MELGQQVTQAFRERFGADPSVLVRAPGRVNLIGEHTDYNDGFVLPMAIDRAVWAALRPAPGRHCRVVATDQGDEAGFDLDGLERADCGGWVEYLRGVAWALQRRGHRLSAWEGVIAGDVPIGAGLSSSAALELATARAFAAVSDLEWDAAAMARVGQCAENQWVGVNCGIMDQMISAAGRADHALLLDCRTLEFALVPLPPAVVVVVLDTGTRRGLVGSAYNERRQQCETAARACGVQALRDANLESLARCVDLDPVAARRARHVIGENERTVTAAAAMRAGDAAALGSLMDASHASLRDDFEVSSPALDAIVAAARRAPGCLGARMTGAGFGGCAVALVQADQADRFLPVAVADYRRATGHEPALYVCQATDGAAVVRR
jgi:galactokinase